MPSFSQIALFAVTAASVVSATNQMTFYSQDNTNRQIVCTPTAGQAPVGPIEVAGMQQNSLEFPDGWIGNCYSVSEGAEDVPGMLAEVSFQGWNGLTYYDVSAIVNPDDHVGVQMMFPASEADKDAKSMSAFSGCPIVFPCNTVYNAANDVQTQSTEETHILVTLGPSSDITSREVVGNPVPRHFVLGKLSAE